MGYPGQGRHCFIWAWKRPSSDGNSQLQCAQLQNSLCTSTICLAMLKLPTNILPGMPSWSQVKHSIALLESGNGHGSGQDEELEGEGGVGAVGRGRVGAVGGGEVGAVGGGVGRGDLGGKEVGVGVGGGEGLGVWGARGGKVGGVGGDREVGMVRGERKGGEEVSQGGVRLAGWWEVSGGKSSWRDMGGLAGRGEVSCLSLSLTVQ